jgi:hypothetical protein
VRINGQRGTRVRKLMLLCAITTLALFGGVAIVALRFPLAGLGICILCLIAYLKPDTGFLAEAGSGGISE